MAEIHFYHLERQSLAKLLPTLLQRGLERGWRSVVQVGSDERVEWLSNELWTYSDDSFLPHGTVRDGHGERQPVWITAGSDAPNRPALRFSSTAWRCGMIRRWSASSMSSTPGMVKLSKPPVPNGGSSNPRAPRSSIGARTRMAAGPAKTEEGHRTGPR